MKTTFLFFLFLLNAPIYAQMGINNDVLDGLDDDINVGGDIFSDFNEQIETKQVLEDERFYRFGRFYSVNFGFGLTSFMGNRGNAYREQLPSFVLSFNYFFNFHSSVIFGIDYSRHQMDINFRSVKDSNSELGIVDVTLLTPFVGYRHYFDTKNLGPIFTYSNPYFTGRLEYWSQRNSFANESFDTEREGAFGGSFGFGVELPLKLKERYLGVEMLYHPVSLGDSNTQQFQSDNNNSVDGFRNLKGTAFSLFVSINETW